MDGTYPIKVWLEKSVSPALHSIFSESPLFSISDEPAIATFIIFEKDTPSYIARTPEYQNWPGSCVVVSETDLPSYFLPGCYASNKKSYLGKNRSVTIPFLASQYYGSNPFIEVRNTSSTIRYLYAFRGGSTSWVRKHLFRMNLHKEDVLIENSSSYHHWNGDDDYKDEKSRQQKAYAVLLSNSDFFLCPRGAGVSSIRLFEVMQAGKVPVILSDNWLPVPDIAWDEFAIFIPEKELSRIDPAIRSQTGKSEKMGMAARRAWEQHCAPEAAGAELARALYMLQKQVNPQHEKWIHTVYPLFNIAIRLKEMGRSWAKRTVLKFFAITGLKFSYELNRPIEEQLKKK